MLRNGSCSSLGEARRGRLHHVLEHRGKRCDARGAREGGMAVVTVEQECAQTAVERALDVMIGRIADVQAGGRGNSGTPHRFLEDLGVRFFVAEARRVDDEVEVAVQLDLLQYLLEVAGPVGDHAQARAAPSQLAQDAVHVVVDAPADRGGEAAVDDLGVARVTGVGGALVQQQAVVLGPKSIHGSLRERQRTRACRARCEKRVGAGDGVRQSLAIDRDLQLFTDVEEDGRLLGIHAQERVSRVEKDSLNVAFHYRAFALRSELRRSCVLACSHMICPVCRAEDTRVIDSRDDDNAVRRRRECQACKHRFTTFERAEAARLFVVKKDGRREAFNRDKVLAGLRKASEKRPISEGAMQAVADEVERELYSRGESEVPSSTIGELVMAALRRLDKIAYIRFASVYRSFTDLNSFQEELAQLLAKTE